MFIFPFIIVFVPDARAQRLHFQRNKQSQIVDRITLFCSKRSLFIRLSTLQFLDQTSMRCFFVPSIFLAEPSRTETLASFYFCLHNTFIFHLCSNIGVVDWSFAAFHTAVHLLLTNIRI